MLSPSILSVPVAPVIPGEALIASGEGVFATLLATLLAPAAEEARLSPPAMPMDGSAAVAAELAAMPGEVVVEAEPEQLTLPLSLPLIASATTPARQVMEMAATESGMVVPTPPKADGPAMPPSIAAAPALGVPVMRPVLRDPARPVAVEATRPDAPRLLHDPVGADAEAAAPPLAFPVASAPIPSDPKQGGVAPTSSPPVELAELPGAVQLELPTVPAASAPLAPASPSLPVASAARPLPAAAAPATGLEARTPPEDLARIETASLAAAPSVGMGVNLPSGGVAIARAASLALPSAPAVPAEHQAAPPDAEAAAAMSRSLAMVPAPVAAAEAPRPIEPAAPAMRVEDGAGSIAADVIHLEPIGPLLADSASAAAAITPAPVVTASAPVGVLPAQTHAGGATPPAAPITVAKAGFTQAEPQGASLEELEIAQPAPMPATQQGATSEPAAATHITDKPAVAPARGVVPSAPPSAPVPPASTEPPATPDVALPAGVVAVAALAAPSEPAKAQQPRQPVPPTPQLSNVPAATAISGAPRIEAPRIEAEPDATTPSAAPPTTPAASHWMAMLPEPRILASAVATAQESRPSRVTEAAPPASEIALLPLLDGTPQPTATAPAEPPAPPPRAAPIPMPVRQVAPFVVALALGPDARVTLTLDPAELGQVEVSIERGSAGEAQVRITAERPETLALLQRDGRELERALNDAGLSEWGASLSFGPGGDTPREAPGREGGRPRQNGGATPPESPSTARRAESGARRGLIDIAV